MTSIFIRKFIKFIEVQAHRDYDEQDVIGLNPNNTLQTNKHGKVRMVYMEQQVAIATFLSHHKVRPKFTQ